MADFEIFDDSSSGGSKKKKIDGKKLLLILGGFAAVAGLFVLLRKSNSGGDAAAVYYPYSTDASAGTSDSGSFISFSELDSLMAGFDTNIADLYKYVDEQTAANNAEFNKQLEEHITDAGKQMAEIVDTNEQMDLAQSQEIYYQSQLNRMISNNRDYDLASTEEKRQNLMQENQIIGKELGLTYHAGTGTWWNVNNQTGEVTRAFYTAAETAGNREKISEYPGEMLVVEKNS